MDEIQVGTLSEMSVISLGWKKGELEGERKDVLSVLLISTHAKRLDRRTDSLDERLLHERIRDICFSPCEEVPDVEIGDPCIICEDGAVVVEAPECDLLVS